MTSQERIEKITKKYEEILELMELEKHGVNKQHIKNTPRRVAKMFINELFKGCYTDPPSLTTFNIERENVNPVRLENIRIRSVCSHHFVPFEGSGLIEYFPKKKIIGISKLARIADYFSRRPQVQEDLTNQIGNYIMEKLDPEYCIVIISARHLCISHRGANEPNTKMVTAFYKNVDVPYVHQLIQSV